MFALSSIYNIQLHLTAAAPTHPFVRKKYTNAHQNHSSFDVAITVTSHHILKILISEKSNRHANILYDVSPIARLPKTIIFIKKI